MTSRSPMRLWLARAGAVGCILMAVIIVSSAYLRLTTMGIGCEPWPACYGRIQSQPAGAERESARHSSVTIARVLHRAAAMLVAILAVFTVLLSVMRDVRYRANVALAVTALALTVMLAVVGRMSATLLVPAVGVANLLGGFGMLACFWALRLNNVARSSANASAEPPLRRIALFALLVFVVQAAAGALISVTYSAALCPTLWRCSAEGVASDRSPQAFDVLAPQPIDASGKVIAAAPAARVQTMHRVSGIATAALFAIFGLWLARHELQRVLGIGLLALGFVEAAIGILMATHDFPLLAALAHNGIAAMLLLMLVRLAWARSSR